MMREENREHLVVLSMIVRDEALTLRRCLASAAPHVDAIVIVDTGSNPEEIPEPETGLRTRQIAEEFGAVFSTTSEGRDEQNVFWSFAKARNSALRFAELQVSCYPSYAAAWILWLDASDVLVGGERIREEIQAAEASGEDCIRFPTKMLDARERVTLRFPRDRIVRANRYAWEGAVHEMLDAKHSGSRIRTADEGLCVRRPFRDRPAREENRNLRILAREVREHARPRELFYLGMEHAQRGDFAEARRWFDVYLRVSRDPDERVLARMMLAELHAARRDQDEALACALRAHAEMPDWPAPKVLIGKLFYLAASRNEERAQNAERACHFLRRAIAEYHEPITHVPVDPRTLTEAHMILGRAAMLVGDHEAADKAFNVVLEADPLDPAAKSLRQQCRAMWEREREAAEVLTRTTPPEKES